MFNHKHNTRLKHGVIKRKSYIEEISDASFNDSSSDSDDEEDEQNDYILHHDLQYNIDDIYKKDYNQNKILAKDKLQYYKFLNKLFPSNYSTSKINKVKRQRLYNVNNSKNNNSNKILDTIDFNNLTKFIQDNNNNNKPINIILNLKDSNNNIFNDKPNNNDKLQYYIYDENEKYPNDEEEEEYEEGEEEEYEEGEEEYEEGEEENNDEMQDDALDESNELHKYENTQLKNEKLKELSKKLVASNSKNVIKELVTLANQEKQKLSKSKKSTPVDNSKNSIKNYKIFDKILTTESKESEYFKKKMSRVEQESAIKKLNTIKNLTTIDTPYLIHLINIDIPDIYKACALKKINMLRSMETGFGNSEYYKIKAWVDTFIKIPFNKYNNLPITFADGIEICHSFMQDAKKTLDSVVYGLDDAKIQIMQLIGLWLVNPNAIGSAIAIKGPMGTGKTTLIKDGISKILNRPFALVALGGCGDSGFLDGHDYVYEGSKYGKIIEILIKSGCMNPVILFDELDKISDSPKGEEITGVLTHLTDTTQNSNYTDKYMSEITLDMSKALYIFSYNDETKVNPILKDRMYKIETKGYKTKDKLVICKDYLLPKIQEISKFNSHDIILSDDVIEYIINDFTEKESGVRNLKRCIEIIYTKLNLYRLMKPDENLFETTIKIDKKVEFPFHLKKEIIDKLLNRTNKNDIPFGMYN
tara:strand:+ start:5828 stop:7927 length:2100 start_codon:yes stop_codon:yes gene_type:complete